jgi:hypothetical protein
MVKEFSFSHFWLNNQASRVKEISFSHFWLNNQASRVKDIFIFSNLVYHAFRVKEFSFFIFSFLA